MATSHFWFGGQKYSDRFPPKNNRYLLGLYLGGKFGEHRWKIEICRAFNSFCVTDSQTHAN